jgi:hypothetical protein
MSANELLVVKLKSMKQQDLVVDCIKTRNQTQKNSFKGYGATQTKLLENSITEVRGNYILYVVDEHAATIRDTFVKALWEGKNYVIFYIIISLCLLSH